MSLRNQFFVSVLAALLFCLSFLGVMTSLHARASVDNEMGGALKAADRFVDSWLASSHGDAMKLVRSFDGNRHVRARLISGGRVIAESNLATSKDVPDWFAALLQIPPETREFKVAADIITLTTDPDNEISETWGQLRDGSVILALFGLLTLGLMHVLMSRTTAPLKTLVAGFESVGVGNYTAQVSPQGPREISQLANAFNRMTERLEKLETANRNLNLQMTTIQEEERADLARDLHDEMGPFLFAMRVDAEAIGNDAQALPSIRARARALGEAVSHIQQHVRNILEQLRPADVAEVSLAQSIANLAAFWQRYHVGVNIHIEMPEAAGFGEQIDAAVYRLVQESLTNAVRHGNANDVSVAIAASERGIRIHIQDNGAGLPDRPEAGMGLRGMQERIAALGGSLTVANRTDKSGAIVSADIPKDAFHLVEAAQ